MSGANKKRRQRFLEEHPWCCFCGGTAETETEDHVPARGLFFGRVWPEGYVFPACAECNNKASGDELILSWLTRVRIGPYNQQEEREYARASIELKRRYPAIWAAMELNPRVKTRQMLRQLTHPSPLLKSTDIVHSITLPDEMFEAGNRYGVKLAKALLYLHTKRVAPSSAIVKAWTFSNGGAMTEMFPHQILSVLDKDAVIQRMSTTLDDQFSYKYAVVEGGEAFAYVANFSESVVMVGAVFLDRERHEKSQLERKMRERSGGA